MRDGGALDGIIHTYSANVFTVAGAGVVAGISNFRCSIADSTGNVGYTYFSIDGNTPPTVTPTTYPVASQDWNTGEMNKIIIPASLFADVDGD
ncbi:hypothetical protein COB52_05495 [Candidatus Kaiserbacteria bacterium]|nr:MAG: hypothetical protein COB52_05495 [Candidatus Kaiserbacteria bacterium]